MTRQAKEKPSFRSPEMQQGIRALGRQLADEAKLRERRIADQFRVLRDEQRVGVERLSARLKAVERSVETLARAVAQLMIDDADRRGR